MSSNLHSRSFWWTLEMLISQPKQVPSSPHLVTHWQFQAPALLWSSFCALLIHWCGIANCPYKSCICDGWHYIKDVFCHPRLLGEIKDFSTKAILAIYHMPGLFSSCIREASAVWFLEKLPMAHLSFSFSWRTHLSIFFNGSCYR